ncbi:MAG: fatty acid desaturase family protein [Myxococcota bacterium]
MASSPPVSVPHPGSKKRRPGLLRFPEDRRSLGVIATYFAVLTAGYLVPVGWPGRIGIAALLCFLSFTCAVITHNTIHAPVFRSRRLERLLHVALTLTYGHPVAMFVPGHNLSHHRFTQTDRDAMRTSKARFRWNLLNQLFFSALVSSSVMKGNLEYAGHIRRHDPPAFRNLMLQTVVYVSFVVGLLILDPLLFLLFVLIPHQYAAWGIMGVNFFQHDGCDPNHRVNHSRNFVGRLVNYLLFNNGYHGAHHMYPTVHWSKLPEVHALKVRPEIHPSLDRTDFLAYLVRTYIYPGRRLDYLGQPVVLGEPEEDRSWLADAAAQPR